MNIRRAALAVLPPFVLRHIARVEASPLGCRLAKGVFWSLAGAAISRGLALIASIFVARILGKTVFGELGIIQSTINMFTIFAGFGLSLTATKYVAEFRKKDPERAGRIIGLSGLVAIAAGGVTALGLLIFAPWLAEHTINAPHLSGILRIAALIMFVNALNGAQTGALSGFEAFKKVAHLNIFVGLISFPILVTGAYYGGLAGATWAMAINLGVNWLLNHLALRKEARRHKVTLTFRHSGQEMAVLWKFSLPAVLAGSMAGPVNWACNAFLVNGPDGYGEMGVLSAANHWYVMLLFLPGTIGKVVLPVFSEQLGTDNTGQSTKTLALAIKMNILIVVPMVVVISVASPYIMNLYGQAFKAGWPTLVVVLFTAGVIAVLQPVGHFIAASGMMWMGFAMNFGWALVFVIGTMLLIGQGSLGLASARGIAYVLHATWTFGFAFLIIRKGRPDRIWK